MRTTPRTRRFARTLGLAAGIGLALLAVRPATAAEGSAPSLARYVPAEGLIIYVEFDGLDAHADAWRKTAAYKVLNETTLGATLEDMLRQLVEGNKANAPVKVSGAEVVTMVEHLFKSGFVIATSPVKGDQGGDPGAKSAEPRTLLVIRDGARKDVRPLFAKLMAAAVGERKIVAKGARKLINVTNDAGSMNWWPEKDDLVITGPPADFADEVIETLDGKRPSALDHPLRAALVKGEDGLLPVGLGFVDLTKFPMPAEAAQTGLDGLKQVDFRWGFQGDALLSVMRLTAPSPRKGFLAVFDQPTFGIKDLPPLPAGLNSFTIVSLEPDKIFGTITSLVRGLDPRAGEAADKAEAEFKAEIKLGLREDLLSQIGPKMAFFSRKSAKGGGIPIPGLPIPVEIPEIVILAQVADGAKFGKTIDKLMGEVNGRLKGMGPPPGPPGSPPLAFQKAEGKGPGTIYTLTPPAGVLPPNAGMEDIKPTLAVGKSTLVITTSPAAAKEVLKLEAASTPGGWKADGAFAAMAGKLPAKMIFLNVSDPRETLPALVTNLPALIQGMNAQLQARMMGPGGMPGGMPPGAPGLTIKLDPARLPKAEELSSRVFPSSLAMSVDDEGIRLIAREPLPSLTSPATGGVMVAMMLPAVQAAREAARRSVCVNNLKQIALAMHNFHDANGNLPAPAIVGKGGKPLLSWRVAILPYLEQQALYDKFKLDEPWDSENNKKLIEEMPKTYLCPDVAKLPAGMTTYLGVTGEGAVFGGKEGIGFRNITDGTSNTLMVVESGEAVPWTKPDDLPINADPARPKAKPGSPHPGGFNAAFCDGSVRFLKNSIGPEVLHALMTYAGGEVINLNALFAPPRAIRAPMAPAAALAAREPAGPRQCTDDLKQIALAIHNHHDAVGKLPAAAIVSKDGKPLLSWRVAILPYLGDGRKDLYEKFKLDEPWDSEHNKKLIEEMPKVYLCPDTDKLPAGSTTYLGIAGEGAVFGGKEAIGLRDILDGTAQTLFVVESGEAVPWTKPVDLPMDADPARPKSRPGSPHKGGFNAMFGDGSVRFLKDSMSVPVLKALMTYAGGEVISADQY